MKEYRFKINGKSYSVSIIGMNSEGADVTVNGVDYEVEFDGETHPEHFKPETAGTVPTEEPGTRPSASVLPDTGIRKKESVSGKTVCSPLPGVVIELKVREGQSVVRGQKIAVLEAMKMENEILAECDGKVTAVYVQKGDSVLEGARIATIA